jgi:dynein light chain LC8-type
LALTRGLFAEDMQQDAIDCAAQAMEKYNIEKDIAAYIPTPYNQIPTP